MEKITIHYSILGNGIKFMLDPNDFNAVKMTYENAQPARGVFVSYDIRSNFADYHPHLENYVVPVLLGLPQPNDLQKIERINFLQTPEMVITYTIEKTKQTEYEQEKQLVLG